MNHICSLNSPRDVKAECTPNHSFNRVYPWVCAIVCVCVCVCPSFVMSMKHILYYCISDSPQGQDSPTMMEMLPKIGVAPPESIFARIERGPWTRKNPLWPLLPSWPGRRIILSLAANTQNTLQYLHKANMKTYLLHKYAANTSRPIFIGQGWMVNKFWWTWEQEGKFAANTTSNRFDFIGGHFST